MDRSKLISPTEVKLRKARIIVGYPLNGGTGFHFNGAQYYNTDTGEYVFNLPAGTVLPENVTYLPLEDSMSVIFKKGITQLLRRLLLHQNIEICFIPFQTSANTRIENYRTLYDGEYRFLSRNSFEELSGYIDQTPVQGAHNGGDFYRRAYYLFRQTPNDGALHYFVNIIPSTYTACTFADFPEGRPVTHENAYEFYLQSGDQTKMNTSRVYGGFYDKITGLIDWAAFDSYEANWKLTSTMAPKANLGGSGSTIAPGIVDEHSLGYAVRTAEMLLECGAKGFHICCENLVPDMQLAAMKTAFGISDHELGVTWHNVSSDNQFLAAINNIVRSIMDELYIE